MSKHVTKILSIATGKNNIIKSVQTSKGETLTPKQAAKKIDSGEKMTFKDQPVQSVGGQFIRTKPDDKTGNNLVKR
jgi:hypothetical protein